MGRGRGRQGVERFPPAEEVPFDDAVARQLAALDHKIAVNTVKDRIAVPMIEEAVGTAVECLVGDVDDAARGGVLELVGRARDAARHENRRAAIRERQSRPARRGRISPGGL